jgi:hypothetical protein
MKCKASFYFAADWDDKMQQFPFWARLIRKYHKKNLLALDGAGE